MDAYSAPLARIHRMYPRKGHLGVGADADLVVVDPQATRRLGVVVHRILLGSGLPLLEQTTRLGQLCAGRVQFFAPFYKITGTEGAPARFFAILDD